MWWRVSYSLVYVPWRVARGGWRVARVAVHTSSPPVRDGCREHTSCSCGARLGPPAVGGRRICAFVDVEILERASERETCESAESSQTANMLLDRSFTIHVARARSENRSVTVICVTDVGVTA